MNIPKLELTFNTEMLHLAHSMLVAVVALGCLVPFGGCGSKSKTPIDASDSSAVVKRKPTIADAKRSLRIGDHDSAAASVYELIVSKGGDIELTVLAAQIEAARNHPKLAIDLASEIDLENSRFGVIAAKLLVEQASKVGDDDAAERALIKMISLAPAAKYWRHRLWRLYNDQGRRQEASDQADVLCRNGEATRSELVSLIRRNEIFPTPKETDELDSNVTSPLARAKWYVARQQFADAERELAKHGENEFETPAAAALYLRVLAEQQKGTVFRETLSRCPDETRLHADYWCALGSWFIDQSQYIAATGLLLRAIEIDPTMRIAFQRLSRCLSALERNEDAAQFRYRGVQIAETETVARRVLEDDQNALARSDLAKMLLELGRPFEALEWTRSVIPGSALPELEVIARQRRQIALTPNTEKIAATTALLGMKKSEFPYENALNELFDQNPPQIQSPQSPIHPPTAMPRLVNVAAAVNADFQWYHDVEINFDSIPLFESVGGGIAVLDFDLDGWPDLYFAQGSGQPPKFACTRSNELRRNLSGIFVDVSEQSRTDDFNYSSGIAAGDVNQDGFPDLYLGALGTNRLLINNGDGTFADTTESLGTKEDFFTTSLAIADIDGDDLPDLFEVNYIENDGGFSQPKKDRDGKDQLPSPLLFFAQSDRFFRSTGDGRFSTIDIQHEIAKPATGLGLVISSFDDQQGNEVFVGNDLRPNHLLRFQDGEFLNLADVRGIANGNHGLANGCMGIATGDFDRSGTLDLHIGNYRNESDNLFLQNENGTFRDAAASYGVRDLSLSLVAFGSKALDFDRNGWLDLAVTNGHIFDMRRVNQGYKMSPHLMISNGAGFQLAEVDDPSGYWEGEYLGRTMAITDFNRNGFSDLVIGHLDAPTALLDNQTETSGHNVILELVGTTSERDAVGARVRVSVGEESFTQWVTAGDGYLCTDEAYLDISIASHNAIESVEVKWPSGIKSVYRDIKPDRRYLLIENEPQSYARP